MAVISLGRGEILKIKCLSFPLPDKCLSLSLCFSLLDNPFTSSLLPRADEVSFYKLTVDFSSLLPQCSSHWNNSWGREEGSWHHKFQTTNRKHSTCLQSSYKHWKLSRTERSDCARPAVLVQKLHMPLLKAQKCVRPSSSILLLQRSTHMRQTESFI